MCWERAEAQKPLIAAYLYDKFKAHKPNGTRMLRCEKV